MEDNSVRPIVQTPAGTTGASVPAEAELGSAAQNLLGWFKQTASDVLGMEPGDAQSQAAQHWQRPQDRLAAEELDEDN